MAGNRDGHGGGASRTRGIGHDLAGVQIAQTPPGDGSNTELGPANQGADLGLVLGRARHEGSGPGPLRGELGGAASGHDVTGCRSRD